MTTEILGSYVFSETPIVNGTPVMLNGGNAPQFASGTFASMPAAGTTGNMYITTDTLKIYRDNGTTWDEVSASAGGGGGVVLQVLPLAVGASSGTTTYTLANTTPTIASGTQVWTQAITPSATTSKVSVQGSFVIAHGTNARTVIAMVFRGSTCIAVVTQYCATASTMNTIAFSTVDTPAATTAQTYSIRVAGSGSGTWYVAQTSTAYFNGLLAQSEIILQELA